MRSGGTKLLKTMAGRRTKIRLLPILLLERSAECLKVMAHPVRLRIVDILMQGEFPVHEIAEMCSLPAHQACEHLRLLKGRGLLDSRRQGRVVYYQIASEQLPALLTCLRRTCSGKGFQKTRGGK